MRKAVHLVFSTVGVVALLGVLAASALATGDANVASCEAVGPIEASPGFLSYLPDCRGLELATPPYKGGEPFAASNEVGIPMSPDGRHLIGIDFAGFAGTGNLEESADFGAAYEFSRGPGGWTTEALSPPASMAARSSFEANSADLSRTLWVLSAQAAPHEELAKVLTGTDYIREGEGATVRWTAVGPNQPEPLPGDEHGALISEGGSDDLGVMLFTPDEGESKYWPGDSTAPGFPSLYQYRGAGNAEPELVGIANEGILNGTPKNSSASLESQCGTTLGSSNDAAASVPGGSAFNAISSAGTVVFFSALHTECGLAEPAATELYARVENGLPTAHTVAISEPSTADCSVCDVSEPAEATFEGASSDGSKVFFLTSQKLLPGAAGQGLYEFDQSGASGQRVKLVASNVSGVSRISDDGARVFFVSTEDLTATPDSTLSPGVTEPTPGGSNLYVYDAATTEYSFVAPLVEADSGLWGRTDVRPIQTTEGGLFTVFLSASLLTPDDHATTPQLFEYDAARHALSRVSVGQKGQYVCSTTAELEAYGCNGNLNGATGPTLFAPRYQFRVNPAEGTSKLAVGDGGKVVFTSPDALTPGAVNDRVFPLSGELRYVENVYEYSNGNVYLISPGDEESPLQTTERSRLLGMSTTESDVLFVSASKLLPQDIDTQADWYDARVGGGLPPETTQSCGEGSCQPPPAPRLSSPLPGGTEVSSAETTSKTAPVKPKAKPESRQTKLKQALRRCAAKRSKARRQACIKLARKKFGNTKKSVNAARKGAHR